MRPRASSAKNNSERQRQRPSSGNSSKNNKFDLIDNLYGNLLSTKRGIKTANKLGEGLNSQLITTKPNLRSYRGVEELTEQNNQLKIQLNKLKNQLNLQKSKNQKLRRKANEYTQKLSSQFEKEIYWGGSNSNMIMGIKHQYQTLKQKYQSTCLELQALQKQNLRTQIKSSEEYSEALEQQNNKLANRLKQAYEELKLARHGTITSELEEVIDANTRSKFELIQIIQNLEEKIQNLQEKKEASDASIIKKREKQQILDKLLIQKGNSQHALHVKLKKTTKEKQNLAQQLQQEKQKIDHLESRYGQRIKSIEQQLKRQAQSQRLIFIKQLAQKTEHISKLQKQIAYLTTMLSYWKPLDQVDNITPSVIKDQGQQQIVLEYSMGSTFIKNKSRRPSKVIQDDEENKSMIRSIVHRKQSQEYKNMSDMTRSIDITKAISKKQRTQITAEKRQTEDGVKSRKVHEEDVSDICQTIKYRLIGLNLPIQQLKKLFEYQQNRQGFVNQQEQNWKKQYINMRQVKEILMGSICSLRQQDAILFSRYLVEDSSSDYVYCDPNNQQLRSVVKSILRNKIGEFALPNKVEEAYRKTNELLDKYSTNLESALKATASKGVVSKKKLLQLFKGLGIELTPEIEDQILGKIILKSDDLNSLRYSVLFSK